MAAFFCAIPGKASKRARKTASVGKDGVTYGLLPYGWRGREWHSRRRSGPSRWRRRKALPGLAAQPRVDSPRDEVVLADLDGQAVATELGVDLSAMIDDL